MKEKKKTPNSKYSFNSDGASEKVISLAIELGENLSALINACIATAGPDYLCRMTEERARKLKLLLPSIKKPN